MSTEITVSYKPSYSTGILKFIHTIPLNDSMEDVLEDTLNYAYSKGINVKVSISSRNNN